MPKYYAEEIEKPKAIAYLNMPNRLEDPVAIKLRDEIIVNARPIVKAIIFTHRFQVYEPFEDCEMIGLEACTKALEKFNPNYVIPSTGKKVLLFNYFSLVAKNSMKWYTMQQQKHRLHYNMDYAEITLEAPEHKNSENQEYIDNLIAELHKLFDERRIFRVIIPVFESYLRIAGIHYKKRELYKFASKEGVSPNKMRNFLKAITINKEDLKDKLL